MAFIRAKYNRSGNVSYHVVRSVRDGKRVKQVMLVSLGDFDSIGDAIADLEKFRKAIAETARVYKPAAKLYVEAVDKLRKLRAIQEETGLP